MFEALKKGFREAQNRLAGLTELTPENIKPALKEVRLSLLEADVELGVIKRFLATVEEEAVGQTVTTRIKHAGDTIKVTAADQFISICQKQLVDMMGTETATLNISDSSEPTKIMMVGLQGSGKTTSSAKLARKFKAEGKTPLLVAADMQRPAAVEQLRVLGESIGVPVFNLPGENPLLICGQAKAEAKKLGCDVIIYDTAGRLAIDENLMLELFAIKAEIQPQNIVLVVDAMIGQDSVQTAKSFHERLSLSGFILTKLDGDARGGAALSIREVTGAPVLFTGTGESTDKLDAFRPEGMASRILGLGDVVGLMKDFESVIDQKKAEEDAARMLSGRFTFEDFLNQIRTIQQMGSLKDLMEKIPGMSQMMPPGADIDESEFAKIEAMIQSMTKQERADAHLLVREPRRVQRIAKGSATPSKAVEELVQKFLYMQQMMESFGGGGAPGAGGLSGMLNKIPGMGGLNMARQMRRAMKSGKFDPAALQGMMPPGMGGFPGMPGMGGFPGMPGMGGFPGMPGMGAPPVGGTMKTLSRSEKNARKSSKKAERSARKQNRKK